MSILDLKTGIEDQTPKIPSFLPSFSYTYLPRRGKICGYSLHGEREGIEPTRLFGACREAAPRWGPGGTWDSAGHLGPDQAGGRGLMGTPEGAGGRNQLCSSSEGPSPLLPPPPSCGEAGSGGADWRLCRFLRLGLGQCLGPRRGPRGKLSHVGMVAVLCGRHHPTGLQDKSSSWPCFGVPAPTIPPGAAPPPRTQCSQGSCPGSQ